MLSLTRKTDYALVALVDLARRAPTRVSAREIAGRMQLPLPMLTNILNQLKTRGLVTSSRGVQGGYCLARRPQDITLAELIDAIEGPFKLTACCSQEGDAAADGCTLQDNCTVKGPVRRVHASLRQFLRQVTLWQIVEESVPVTIGASSDVPVS